MRRTLCVVLCTVLTSSWRVKTLLSPIKIESGCWGMWLTWRRWCWATVGPSCEFLSREMEPPYGK